jgi:hypothetical protein
MENQKEKITYAHLLAQGLNNVDGEIFIFISQQTEWFSSADPKYDDITYHLTLEEAIEQNKKISVNMGWDCIIDKVKYYVQDIAEYLEDNDISVDEELDFNNLPSSDHYDTVYNGDYGSGESIENDIIVEWSWEKYPGYSRNRVALHYANYLNFKTESDLITGNEERTFRTNYSVLVKASELEDLNDDEKRELVLEKLNDSIWKWNHFNSVSKNLLLSQIGLDLKEEIED